MFIISSFLPLGTTGSTWRKSPPNTTTLPPKGKLQSFLSCNIISRASIVRLSIIGVSSHIMSFVSWSNLAKSDYLLTLQVILSSIWRGSLNLEWVVQPPGNILVATPEEVVASAIKFLDLIVASITRFKNVFPVPPGPSIKKMLHLRY